MNWFNRRSQDWELIDKTVLPSAYEQLREGGQSLTKAGNVVAMFSKTVIYTFKDRISGVIKQEKHES